MVPEQSPKDWSAARPETVAEPTLWPPCLAFGVTLCLWGLASSLILTAVGLGLFVLALAGWIKDIRHERKGPVR